MATGTHVLFPWSDTFNAQVGVVDSQHKVLVGIINDLHQAMVSGHGKDQPGKNLTNLITHTKGHFSTEEQMMQQKGYPDYARHKAEHGNLTKTVIDFQKKFQNNEVGLTLEVMNFLKDWLGKHIMESDKRPGAFMGEHGVH